MRKSSAAVFVQLYFTFINLSLHLAECLVGGVKYAIMVVQKMGKRKICYFHCKPIHSNIRNIKSLYITQQQT